MFQLFVASRGPRADRWRAEAKTVSQPRASCTWSTQNSKGLNGRYKSYTELSLDFMLKCINPRVTDCLKGPHLVCNGHCKQLMKVKKQKLHSVLV